MLVTQVVLLPQRDGCDLCGAMPADVLHINRTSDAFGTPRPPSWFDYFSNHSRPNLYAFDGVSASLPACAGAPACTALCSTCLGQKQMPCLPPSRWWKPRVSAW